MKDALHFESIAAHAGAGADDSLGDITSPIHLSTIFWKDAASGYTYTRHDNPTRKLLEHTLAQLQGGAGAVAFGSGVAAAAAVFMALAPGDHVIAHQGIYHGIRKQLQGFWQGWGLQLSLVDTTDLAATEAAITPHTKLLWLETPSNPLLEVSDLAALATLAQRRGLITVCDNTFATPYLQNPLALGIDLVMHSTTKYLGGHSDVLGGALVAKEETELFARIRQLQSLMGAVPAPFDCWLTLRGIRSLVPRMRMHCSNAQQVAEYLNSHPRVSKVHYPGLPQHAGHSIAQRQMRAFGGVVSFEVKGGAVEALRVVQRCKLFLSATSLGGTESLVEHRYSSEGPGSSTPEGLLRLSVGIEQPDDLIQDLQQALAE